MTISNLNSPFHFSPYSLIMPSPNFMYIYIVIYISLIPVDAVHMCMTVGSSTGTWRTYQVPYPSTEWFSSLQQLSTANNSSAMGRDSEAPPPSMLNWSCVALALQPHQLWVDGYGSHGIFRVRICVSSLENCLLVSLAHLLLSGWFGFGAYVF